MEGGRAADRAVNPIFAGLPVSVFEVMSALAREHDAVNLGQGFPDDPGPEDVRRKAAEAVVEGWNQYPSMLGLIELRRAVAAHYQHWQGLALDPDFATNHYVYVYYSQPVSEQEEAITPAPGSTASPTTVVRKTARPVVVRFTDRNGKGEEQKVIVGDLPVTLPEHPGFNAKSRRNMSN